jgi:hypothetical protein
MTWPGNEPTGGSCACITSLVTARPRFVSTIAVSKSYAESWG